MSQIDVLPDDVLLEIFYFCVDTRPSPGGIPSDESKAVIEAWQLLVHVCQRWRSLVFGSPRRLNLRLCCTSKTCVRDTLDIWPAFPLVVDSGMIGVLSPGVDNIIAALGESNRICQVSLYLGDRRLKEVLAAMQVPFPELTDLRVLSPLGSVPPIIPESFLRGSAPRLKSFTLGGTPFPGLPKLLLSATHLVELRLINIPHSGCMLPEAVVAITSVLSGLRIFSLDFQSRQSRPTGGRESRSLPRRNRSVFPVLEKFQFKGVNKYLEDLVTRIDAPRIDEMHITFFSQDYFDCSLLAQFIDRSPTLRGRNEAHVQLTDYVASVALQSQCRTIKIGISCTGREPDRQLSSVAQVCNAPFLLSAVEDLYIVNRLVWKDDATIENRHWLQLLLPFTAVKSLYLSEEYAPGIAATLQELAGGRITEVLPSLQKIFVESLETLGPFQENIGQFVATRQLSDQPIAISSWRKDSSTTWR
jgi:hypothetical protein